MATNPFDQRFMISSKRAERNLRILLKLCSSPGGAGAPGPSVLLLIWPHPKPNHMSPVSQAGPSRVTQSAEASKSRVAEPKQVIFFTSVRAAEAKMGEFWVSGVNGNVGTSSAVHLEPVAAVSFGSSFCITSLRGEHVGTHLCSSDGSVRAERVWTWTLRPRLRNSLLCSAITG